MSLIRKFRGSVLSLMVSIRHFLGKENRQDSTEMHGGTGGVLCLECHPAW